MSLRFLVCACNACKVPHPLYQEMAHVPASAIGVDLHSGTVLALVGDALGIFSFCRYCTFHCVMMKEARG